MPDAYRQLPSVDSVLRQEKLRELTASYSHATVLELVRNEIDAARRAIAAGQPAPAVEAIVEAVCLKADTHWRITLEPVVNATGVILHTNLGRAPLSAQALEAAARASAGYSNLEFDLDSGERGERQAHVERLLCQLTGAEAALAVNNNASAVLLALSALAEGREVVVSRGEAVEIGGGFRIPEVLQQSGARLVEVGTTNRTYVQDYERALGAETAAVLRVHTSNFQVRGFVHRPQLAELAELCRRHGVQLLDDLGSGCLLDTTEFGLDAEPRPQDAIAEGADLVFFSGDKLLGGPQAGIVVGRSGLVSRLRSHPLARAVRLDKMGLAALSATLLHYLRQEARSRIPLWQMIAVDEDRLRRRARRWARAAGGVAQVVQGESRVGGGSLPGSALPTYLVAIEGGEGLPPAEELARRLRRHAPPVIGRIERNALLLDPRTVLPRQDSFVLTAIASALER